MVGERKRRIASCSYPVLGVVVVIGAFLLVTNYVYSKAEAAGGEGKDSTLRRNGKTHGMRSHGAESDSTGQTGQELQQGTLTIIAGGELKDSKIPETESDAAADAMASAPQEQKESAAVEAEVAPPPEVDAAPPQNLRRDVTVEIVKLDTPIGPIEAKQVGDPNGIQVLMVHGMAQHLVWEWEDTALALAKEGCHVVMPNFHSNPGTKPGKNPKKVAAAISSMLKTMKEATGGTSPVLMGKSWGGGTALEYAIHHPDSVSKLVLAAPAGATPGEMAKLTVDPALLCWTRDDPSWGKAEGLARALPHLQTDFEDAGGHRVVPEYIPNIVKFVLGKSS